MNAIQDDGVLRETFKQVWFNAMIGMAFVAKDGRFLAANPMLCSILEYTEEELQERTFDIVTHPDDVRPEQRMRLRVADPDDVNEFTMTKRYITKTGRVTWTVLRVRGVHHENQFRHFVAQVTEVHEEALARIAGKEPPALSPGARLWTAIIKNWGVASAIAGSLGLVIASAIRFLMGDKQP